MKLTALLLAGTITLAGCGSVPDVAPSDGEDREVSTFLDGFDGAALGGIPLPRGFTTDRTRMSPTSEESFVATVRSDPTIPAGLPDDDVLLYLGYLYCALLDGAVETDRAIAGVVDVLARSRGHDPSNPPEDDFITAVVVVNYASGGLCGDRFDETRAFLDDLTGVG